MPRVRQPQFNLLRWLIQNLDFRLQEKEEGFFAKYFSPPFYDPQHLVLAIACVGFVLSVYDTIQLLKSPVLTKEMQRDRILRTSKHVFPELERDTKLVFTFVSVEHNALLFAGVVASNASFLLPWLVASGGVILFGSLFLLLRFLKDGTHVTSSELVVGLVFLFKVWHVFWFYTSIKGYG